MFGGGLEGMREALMTYGRKVALAVAACALGACTPASAPRPPANGVTSQVSPHPATSEEGPPAVAPETADEDGLDPAYRLVSVGSPLDPVFPRALAVLLQAEAGGLPIYTTILSLTNLSPRDVERAAATGDLNNVNKHPGTTFLGAVGEAIVAQFLLTGGAGPGRTTVVHQPPKATLPAGLTGEPDLKVTEVGFHQETKEGFREHVVNWSNTVGPRTGGLMAAEPLGANTVVSYWEITVTAQYTPIYDRALKVAKWAALFGGSAGTAGAAKAQNTTVKAAVLAIDRGAYFGLTPADRTKLNNTVTGAGGFIRIYRDLSKNANLMARALYLNLAPVSRP